MTRFAFGDIVENPYYLPTNQYRKGIFIEKTNKGDYRLTNGQTYWKVGRDALNLQKIGNVLEGDKL